MDLTGRLIGNRYEIIEKIGCGGMATVYKAKSHVLNRNVAVKILREEFTTDEEFIKRFNDEAQAVASLTHPNIVSVYDAGSEGDLHYIVMELVQGKTLKEIITENGILPWKWSVNIAIQIASALETAHRNNIVHRDIKPHNIIINEDGIVKVTDFGIAKAVSNSTITAFGSTIGSVHYFSPEHARGGYTDAKSDIYSLGVVMYEMMTGKVPFDADTPVSIALKHMQERATEPKILNSTIPDSVNNIIMKAMQKDPGLRYQTATEMLRDLREALKNPNANFVNLSKADENSYTKKIDVDEIEKQGKRNTKKKGKLKEYLNKHKVVKYLLAFLICIIVFVASMGITALVINKSRPNQVQIPNLVGVKLDEAKAKLDELKLKYEITEEYDAEKEAGIIILQDPKFQENYRINETEKIKLVVSKGQEMTTVPKVIGQKKEDAIKALEESKLKIEIIEENNEKVEEGIVIKQEPSANEEIAAGTSVKVYVSLGIKKLIVSNVIGKTEEEAKKELQELGLSVIVNTEENSSKEKGVIIKQSIEAGKEVDEGTKITITKNTFEESKYVDVTIDVKSITGGYNKENSSDDDATVNSVPEKVNISIVSDYDTLWSTSNVDKNDKKTAQILGKGSMDMKVIITDNDGGYWTKPFNVNFNTETSKTIK